MSDVLPHVKIPEPKPVTPEEVARRQKIFDEVSRLRERMPPLGFDAADLIREIREGVDHVNE